MGSTTDSHGNVVYKTRIHGRLWRIRLMPSKQMGQDWGRCDHPPGRHPKIDLKKSLSKFNLLDTTIHEVLHAVRPELDEETVDVTATTIARALYRMGWERTI
jgi:hypothetical protein